MNSILIVKIKMVRVKYGLSGKLESDKLMESGGAPDTGGNCRFNTTKEPGQEVPERYREVPP